MIYRKILLLSGALITAAGCGESSVEASPEMKPLPVPTVTVVVANQTADVHWAISEEVEAVRFTFELYAGDAEAPVQSATTRLTSQRFGLDESVVYRFRVCATAPLNSVVWEDSPFSDYTVFSDGMLGAPVARLVDASTDGATLSWTTGAGAVTSAYELYEGDATTAVRSGETAETTVALTGLSPRTAYRFRVKALAGGDGTDSTYSEEVAFTTDREPVEPDTNLGLPLANENDGILRAFPGAEGGGMYTTGGRGGKVYHVTKLTDDGSAGTLRHAVSQSGARTIVFDVAGTIRLQKGLEIKNGDLTIAGQTAPGDGICLRDFPVTVKADNVIIRYLRFRLGDTNAADDDDTIWGRYRQNVILDHCSMSWCIDECASFYANKNFTMQWCLLSESLHNSGHSKGSHGYGGIWGGAPASYHHNVLAHHDSRNPRFDEPNAYDYTGYCYDEGSSPSSPVNYEGDSGFSNDDRRIDYRNNVVYNFCNYPAYGGEGAQINFVGNYYKWGPASVNGLGKAISTSGKETTDTGKKRSYFYSVDCAYTTGGKVYDPGAGAVYCNDNTLDTSVSDASVGAAVTADNSKGFMKDKASLYKPEITWLSAPLAITAGRTCYVTSHSAGDAFSRTLAYAGASLARDAVDLRVVDDVKNGKANVMAGSNGSKNGIIDRPGDTASASAAFGATIGQTIASDGYPELTATAGELARVKDTDGDGIPDYYEELLGLDPQDAADGNATTLDPQGIYTNLEVYLHYLVREITAAQVEGGNYTAME